MQIDSLFCTQATNAVSKIISSTKAKQVHSYKYHLLENRCIEVKKVYFNRCNLIGSHISYKLCLSRKQKDIFLYGWAV